MRYVKIFTLLFAILGSFKSHAQTDALDYADSISKATGITYLNMFGTKVLVPKPEHAAIRRDINVLEIYNDSMQQIADINVLELPVYETNTLPDYGSVPFSIKGHTGKLFRKSIDEGVALTFVCEDEESKIYIVISFLGTDKQTEERYLDILKNIRYDKNIKIHTRLLPFLARFTIDAASSGYWLIGVTKGAYKYSPNGIKPESVSEPQMWIREHRTGNMSELRYLDVPAMPYGVMVDSIAKNVEEPTVDGFKVYTVVMYIGAVPNRLMVYQTARTNGVISVVMTAIATSDLESNLALFTKMAKTFHARGTNDIKLFEH